MRLGILDRWGKKKENCFVINLDFFPFFPLRNLERKMVLLL